MVINLMTKAEIKAKIFKHYISLRKLNDYGVTAYIDTDYDEQNKVYWSIVMCLDEESPDFVKCMIAYRSKNSIMTEYDWDFTMPYDEASGEVDDTQTSLFGNMFELDKQIDYVLKEYERIEETYFGRGYSLNVA